MKCAQSCTPAALDLDLAVDKHSLEKEFSACVATIFLVLHDPTYGTRGKNTCNEGYIPQRNHRGGAKQKRLCAL